LNGISILYTNGEVFNSRTCLQWV